MKISATFAVALLASHYDDVYDAVASTFVLMLRRRCEPADKSDVKTLVYKYGDVLACLRRRRLRDFMRNLHECSCD